MPITDSLVLPADTLVVPVTELSQEVRRQVQAGDGDYALTRPRSRTPSRIVDADAAALIQEFRQPATVVQAVLRYSKARSADPEKTLEEAFPMLERLVQARLLVEADSQEARQIRPVLETGAEFAECKILGCVQALADTDLYRAQTAGGETAAMKMLRPGAPEGIGRMFDREEFVLKHLDGSVSPRLIRTGVENDRRYLLLEWCPGVDCSAAASELRRTADREGLVRLCHAILECYARLHSQHVVHSDIHPRNVLVNDSGSVKIVDFGLARLSGVESEFRQARRGGVAFYYEPEYASAVRDDHRPPASTFAGEQYGLASLLYFLVTGKHYLDFSLEKQEMLRQIAEDAPLPFEERGIPGWPEMESVLARALSKKASERFPSVEEMAASMRSVTVPAAVPAAKEVTEPCPYPEAEALLEKMLDRCRADGPLFASGLAAAPKLSVTYGAAGIACGLCRIAAARDDAALLSLADLWATRALRDRRDADAYYCTGIEITPDAVGRVSPYHTESGIHAVQGLIGYAMSDVVAQQAAIDSYIQAATAAPCDNIDVTLGRSGVLLGAALLLERSAAAPYVDVSRLRDFGNDLESRIWDEVASFKPVRECRDVRYTGIAHGWAGILYATLSWRRAAGAAVRPGFAERLEQLAGLAEHTGTTVRWNWTVSSRKDAGGYMAGWCNGSAGFVFLWTLAHQALGEEAYLRLAEKSAWYAWEGAGQIGNLCCGYAGQAYSLLNLYKHTHEKGWLHRAQALAQRAARTLIEMPSTGGLESLVTRAESLYKGELGVAVLAAELSRPEFAAMPFFECCPA